MPLQTTEHLELGDIKVTEKRATVFVAPHIGTGIVVVVFDVQKKIGGIAHVVLPESSLAPSYNETTPGKYADVAIPCLMEQYQVLGGVLSNTTVRLIGGAQLFNFGGGGGNLLNIGARNVTAIRAALTKYGLAVDKADIGGNKAKSLRFIMANGQLAIKQIGGGDEYYL